MRWSNRTLRGEPTEVQGFILKSPLREDPVGPLGESNGLSPLIGPNKKLVLSGVKSYWASALSGRPDPSKSLLDHPVPARHGLLNPSLDSSGFFPVSATSAPAGPQHVFLRRRIPDFLDWIDKAANFLRWSSQFFSLLNRNFAAAALPLAPSQLPSRS